MQEILNDMLSITGFSDEDKATLKGSSGKTSAWADDLVSMFYDTLFSIDVTKAVFTEGERQAREKTLRDWYTFVIQGDIDDKFWKQQWFVGLIHIKRGVHNHFMYGIMSRVQELFLQKSLADLGPEEGMKVYQSFKRVTDIIACLIGEGYRIQYIDAVVRTSGIKKTLIDRMASLEVDKMIAEGRA